MYGWRITKVNPEFLEQEEVNTVGPATLSAELEHELFAGYGQEFKMYDDDDIWYYTGMIVGEFEGTEPLDDFGTPNAGCTRIEVE